METKRVVVVCGGRGNIGTLISNHELERGSYVICIDRLGYESTNKSYICIGADLSSHGGCLEAARQVSKRVNRIDSLVMAAALDSVPDGDVSEFNKGLAGLKFEQLSERIDVNIKSQIYVVALLSSLLHTGSHICLFSSIYGVRSPDHRIYGGGFIKPIEYSISKSSMLGMCKHLAVTLANDDLGRVNALILGGLESKRQDPEFTKRYINKVPLRRMMRADDILNAYDFISKEESGYITGTTLTVDGGYTAW